MQLIESCHGILWERSGKVSQIGVFNLLLWGISAELVNSEGGMFSWFMIRLPWERSGKGAENELYIRKLHVPF